VNGDGEEDKNYNRIQTGRRGCGWGQYSGDGMASMVEGMGIKWWGWIPNILPCHPLLGSCKYGVQRSMILSWFQRK